MYFQNINGDNLMYIYELVYKIIQKIKSPKIKKEIKEEKQEEEVCEHVFLPVDSTKKILACTKCGFLIKADDILKKTNNKKDSV